MKKLKVYLDTSAVSYLYQDDARGNYCRHKKGAERIMELLQKEQY